jgi:hypothetical protein
MPKYEEIFFLLLFCQIPAVKRRTISSYYLPPKRLSLAKFVGLQTRPELGKQFPNYRWQIATQPLFTARPIY